MFYCTVIFLLLHIRLHQYPVETVLVDHVASIKDQMAFLDNMMISKRKPKNGRLPRLMDDLRISFGRFIEEYSELKTRIECYNEMLKLVIGSVSYNMMPAFGVMVYLSYMTDLNPVALMAINTFMFIALLAPGSFVYYASKVYSTFRLSSGNINSIQISTRKLGFKPWAKRIDPLSAGGNFGREYRILML